MKKTWFGSCVLFLCSLLCWAEVPVNEITRQKVLSAEGWQASYDVYSVDPAKIEILKSKMDAHLRVDIYFGLWCPDSQRNVPAFLKMLDLAGVTVPVHLYSAQRKPVASIKYYSDQYRVEKVPTFIFYRNNVEIGRIIENPSASMLEDTTAIISK
jgi:thioredoxin 1